MATKVIAPASVKQTAYIAVLLKDRDVPEDVQEVASGPLNIREASMIIGTLRSLPKRPVTDAKVLGLPDPGYYVRDGQVFVVVWNKAHTATYAKQLVIVGGRGRWDYVPGAGKSLAGTKPLTVEEAGRLGRLHGVCVVCGRQLTVPEHAQRGIGPVCITRL